MNATIAKDRAAITVHVPLTFRKRGGRKQIVAPHGADPWTAHRVRVDSTMVKAIARGFRWRTLLETGVHSTIDEIATAEKITASYVSRLLRLTLLSPALVEAILDGRQPADITLASLTKPFPVEWERQKTTFRLITRAGSAQLVIVLEASEPCEQSADVSPLRD